MVYTEVMKNYRGTRPAPETEEKHGYYNVGDSFTFKTITTGKGTRLAMLDNSEPVSIRVRVA